jgi:hypothetical protein
MITAGRQLRIIGGLADHKGSRRGFPQSKRPPLLAADPVAAGRAAEEASPTGALKAEHAVQLALLQNLPDAFINRTVVARIREDSA